MKPIASTIKILHLEDEISDAEQVARLLHKADFPVEIKVVDSRVKFEQGLRTFSPDVIISDHNLPTFNSMEAFALLKKSGLKIPFVLVTGTVSEEFAVEAMRTGADDYILKDRMQRLPIAIASVVQKYRMEREQRKIQAQLLNIDINSLDVICSMDEEGRFIHLSAASETVLGYSPAELKGKKYIDYVLPADVSLTKLSAESVVAGNPVTMFENRYIRKDGTIIPLLWSARWDDTEKIMYCTAKDATEKKRSEQAFKSEQKRFINLFLEAPAAIGILKGPTHVYEICNPLFLEFTGRKNILGKTATEVFPELESQGLIRLLDKVYQTGQTISRKEILLKLCRDSTGKVAEIFCDYVCQPFRNSKGEVEGIFFFAVDVTAQVHARRKIEESKNQYVNLVQNLPVAVYTCDAEGHIMLYNKAALTLWGRKPVSGEDKWCGSSRMLNDDQQNIPHGNSPMAQLMQGQEIKDGVEIFVERPDGNIRNVISHPRLTYDGLGNVSGGINMLIDITDQKVIEEENRKLSYVASLTVNAVIVTDAEGKITWVNHGFERITEYSMSEVIGKTPGDLLQGVDTDTATIQLMRESRKEGKGFRVEILNYSKSGRKYWLDIEVVPMFDKHNRLTGFMAIEQDITERKRSERETLSLINNLQAKNKDLQQFSYIVSHNLRSPIAKILGLINIMGDDPEENKELIKMIGVETTNLDEVVKDINMIVAARKSESEKREKVNLEKKFNKVLQVLEPEITESGAIITGDFSQVTEIETIKSYLYSILYNLVSNAIKYRKPDVAPHINIRTTQNDPFVCLLVEDNGMGIDLTKAKSKIFGLYKRFHGDDIPGKGVGLNLVKTHAESLGGRVEVQSEVNKGSTFKIFIPKHYGTNNIN